MGKQQKLCVQPDKYGNLELLKIQNFLHLTPPAVKKQCAALRDFCTKFPEDLVTDEACEIEFPVDVHTVDYVASAKNPRDNRSRTVEKKVRLCNLALDAHARSKIIQLAGEKRYNRKTDILTIKANRCPLRKQNLEYTDYLLTALYFESWKKESWETPENMHNDGSEQAYWWTSSQSYNNLKRIVEAQKKTATDNKLLTDSPEVRDYCEAVTAIKLEPEPFEKYKFSPERAELVDNYRTSVIQLLGLESIPDSTPPPVKQTAQAH